MQSLTSEVTKWIEVNLIYELTTLIQYIKLINHIMHYINLKVVIIFHNYKL